MMVSELINANPVVHERQERRARLRQPSDDDDEYAVDPIDQQEIFDHLRDIKDPEHPYTLEELKVVTEDDIEVDDRQSHVRSTFSVDILVAPGSHATESAVNKQLNDKERVAAALENPNLLDMVEDCLAQRYV